MFTHSIQWQWQEAGSILSKTQQFTADGETNRSVDVPGAGETVVVDYSLRVAELQSFYLVSSQNVVVTPHDTSNTPMTAINLTANFPFVWVIGSGITNPFASDIGSLYINNPGASSALVDLRSLMDSTPANPVGS